MLPKFGRSAMRSRVGVAELDWAVDDPASGNLRMINRGERADCVGLRIFEHFGVGAHGRPDEVVVIENRRPLVCALRCDHAIDLAGERSAVLSARGGILEAGIVQPIGPAKRSAEVWPMAIALNHHEVNPSPISASI